jgi:hypothetical protein
MFPCIFSLNLLHNPQQIQLPISHQEMAPTEPMLPTEQHKAYCNFYDSVRSGAHLDPRTTAMVGLAAAMARECQP